MNWREDGSEKAHAQREYQRRFVSEEGCHQCHEELGDPAFVVGHGMGKGHHHGEDEDDPPRHPGIHHRLEPEQRLAVDLEETHHGYEEHTDARVPDGLEEAGDAGRGGQDVGQKQQDDQRKQEPQHDFLDFIQPQRTFRVQPSRIQRDQFLHVGLEHVLGHDDEQQGAQRAACYRNDHVLSRNRWSRRTCFHTRRVR